MGIDLENRLCHDVNDLNDQIPDLQVVNHQRQTISEFGHVTCAYGQVFRQSLLLFCFEFACRMVYFVIDLDEV